MAKIAAAVHRDVPVVVIHDDLRTERGLSQASAELLQSAGRILIVDDVMNSGTRLNDFVRVLRERFGTFDSVMFLVGVLRTQSQPEYEENRVALTKNYPWRSQLSSVHTIYLPRWNADACPWCHERDFLSGVSEALVNPPGWLTDRISLLSRREAGVVDQPLFCLPGISPRPLGSGSPVGPEGLSVICTLFTIASGLQCLRTDRDAAKRLHPRFPDMNVFGLQNLKNYSEGMLRAVLLRLVRPYEWGTGNSDLLRALSENAKERGQEAILGELLLSVARGSVPPPGRKFFEETYSRYLGSVAEAFSRSLHL